MRDLLVIGGGINGAGIARDATGRGLSVTLVEKDDLAAHTSSASTKLVHGGLRYLENYDFRLVREALHEREVLLKIARHLVRPIRFVLPHEPGLRPRWMLRTGLFLYDRLGGRRSLPASRSIRLDRPPHRAVLQPQLTDGFEYSDCWVDDARLVVLNALDARERGCEVLVRTQCVALERRADHWRAVLRGPDGERILGARAVANAAGPWVDEVAGMATGGRAEGHLRLVKGSHIVVPRRFPGEHAYIFQNGDGRIVFAIPYEAEFTLIGTTDMLFEGDKDDVRISREEIDYLCAAVSEYFRSPVTPDEVVSTYAGIRPLYEDNSRTNATVTRDYVFALDDRRGPPLLSVYGGKITTYRRLAEHALARLAPHLGFRRGGWTGRAALPGGDFADFAALREKMGRRYPWAPAGLLDRQTRAYGTRIDRILGRAAAVADMGEEVADGLFAAELRYLVDEEWARTAEDVLWRRTKLGLHLPVNDQRRVEEWLAAST
jgi:glycerol-3-phosphate dehydrogenase